MLNAKCLNAHPFLAQLPPFLLTFCTLQEEYVRDRKLAKLGAALAEGTVTSLTKMSVDQALYLRHYGKMGKVGYTNLRLAMLPFGIEMPTYNHTSDHKFGKIVPLQLVSYISVK